MPETVTECPHCGRPSLFPNVIAAKKPEEEAALNVRVAQSYAEAAVRGTTGKVNEFAAALATGEAVINRYFGELFRLGWSDDQIYSTYYQRVNAGMQLPEGDSWNRLRGIADSILFGDKNKASIRFAALSLDGIGLEKFGECSMTLKTPMIAHRASVFEENSVVFMERHDISGRHKFVVPPGFRAPWDKYIALCLAKLTGKLLPDTPSDTFPGILLFSGSTLSDDDFVEVHIWGSLTIRSFRQVVVRQWNSAYAPVDTTALAARLSLAGVEFVTP